MNSSIKFFFMPVIFLITLVILIYISLYQFSEDLSNAAVTEKNYLQSFANAQLAQRLNKRLEALEMFASSAAVEDLVINNHISEIASSLENWRKTFNLPLFTFFDVESNTLYLSDAPSRAGETYGLSSWITEQLSGPTADPSPRLVMFRGKPTWLKSATVQVAGEIRGLLISGVILDQAFVNELSGILFHPVILSHSDGIPISSNEAREKSLKDKITLDIPAQLKKSGYRLDMLYNAVTPYRHVKEWPFYGVMISLLIVLATIIWLIIQYNKQLRQWRFIGSLADSPGSLKALPLNGTEKTVADNIANEIEKLILENETLTNRLTQVEHINDTFRKNLKQVKGEKNRLQHAPRIKSGFLSRMGDEITSPMKSVSSMLKLLAESKLGDEPTEVVEIATRSHQMMSSNIENVLDFSKLDAGMLKLFLADFDMEVLIRELIKELKPHAQSKELKMEWHIHDRVPESCYGDRQRIHQILYNLAGNAIRFTKEGTIGIYVDTIYEKGRQFIRYTVTDTGIGIPKPAQEAVFESLDPHSKLTTSSFAGRLRLIVSKQLTEIMGGNMGLSSEVGKGSRFWFTIRYQNPRGQQK